MDVLSSVSGDNELSVGKTRTDNYSCNRSDEDVLDVRSAVTGNKQMEEMLFSPPYSSCITCYAVLLSIVPEIPKLRYVLKLFGFSPLFNTKLPIRDC